MNLEFTQEQKILRESVAKFCKTEIPMETVRELTENPVGLTDALWTKIAEQGWLGVLIPEAYGGLGLGVTELGIILEEMGRALVPGPYFASAVLGGPAIAIRGGEAMKKTWLEKITTGEARATLALMEEDAQLGADHIRAEAKKSGAGYILNGKKFFVPDAAAADAFVVAARTSEGVTLFLVPKSAKGVSVEPNKLTDMTSRSGQLVLKDVSVGADALIGAPGKGWDVVDQVLQIANVGIAAGSVAAAEQVLQTTVAYARERTQFGVPIGSFQAVKHPLANLFADIESARSAYHYAAWAIDAASEDVRRAVAIARVTASDAFRKATLDCLQAHGGIGFTWEYDLHLYLKRAQHNMYFLGMNSDYEEVIAREGLGI